MPSHQGYNHRRRGAQAPHFYGWRFQRMIRNLYTRLAFIVIVAALAIWLDAVPRVQIINPFNDAVLYERNVTPRLGLDLQGGLQVLLEADVAADVRLDASEMETARSIVENRT